MQLVAFFEQAHQLGHSNAPSYTESDDLHEPWQLRWWQGLITALGGVREAERIVTFETERVLEAYKWTKVDRALRISKGDTLVEQSTWENLQLLWNLDSVGRAQGVLLLPEGLRNAMRATIATLPSECPRLRTRACEFIVGSGDLRETWISTLVQLKLNVT